MSESILTDRAAQLVMSADGAGYDEARLRLQRATLFLDAEPNLDTAHQALVLAAASCAIRMFRGGVFLGPTLGGQLTVGQRRPEPLRAALEALGAKSTTAPEHAVRLFVGRAADVAPDLYAACDGWTARISPEPLAAGAPGNVLSGAAAGGLAIAELFRKAVLDDVLAARRLVRLDLWGPGTPPPAITRLPKALWLLGLGNLGQANLFVLDLLPWTDTAAVTLLLHDADTVGPENLDVQLLTQPNWIGRKKARAAADWADARGFRTIIEERLFTADTRPSGVEPRLALVGVDNLDARRRAAKAGFDLTIDAGLGATGLEAFDIRLHAFPGAQDADCAWPASIAAAPRRVTKALEKLVAEGRLDSCGAMTIAGTSVGVPCTALVAAALQVAQACRALETDLCADRVDLSLADLRHAAWRTMLNPLPARLLSVAALAPSD